jgi:hypothetical protein
MRLATNRSMSGGRCGRSWPTMYQPPLRHGFLRWEPPHTDSPISRERARLIIKDAIMLGAAVVTLADSARTWLWRNP